MNFKDTRCATLQLVIVTFSRILVRINQLVTLVVDQVVYAMDPRPPFSERVLPMVKTMTDGRSVNLISGDLS